MGRASASNQAALGVMPFALFGIDSDGIGMVLNLLVIFLVAIWLALVFWTYADSRRRLTDPVLIGSALIASVVFPFAGALVYAIVRPPETLEDAYERDLDVRAAELRVRLLEQAVRTGPSGGGFAATVAGEISGEPAGRKPGAQSGPKAAAPRRADAAKPATQAGSAERQGRTAETAQSSRPAAGGPSRPNQSQRPSAGSPAHRPPATGADGA